jgi:hypothetical protein
MTDNIETPRARNAVFARKRKLHQRGSTSAKAARRLERQTAIREGRLAHRTLADIAKELGVSEATAYRDSIAAMAKLTPTVEDLRAQQNLEVARIDAMCVGIYPAACKGDHRAIDSMTKLMTLRCRLTGLLDPKGEHLQLSVKAGAGDLGLAIKFVSPTGEFTDEPKLVNDTMNDLGQRLLGYNPVSGGQVPGYDPLAGKPIDVEPSQPEAPRSPEPPRPQRQSTWAKAEPRPEPQKDPLHVDTYMSMSPADKRRYYGGINGEGAAPGGSAPGRRRHWMG